MSLRIVFMGTPDFAVPSLQALLQSEHQVVGVFTQPDRPAGRGQKLAISPVKAFALEKDWPIFQPVDLKTEAHQALVKNLRADVLFVAAYGLILPEAVLQAAPFGAHHRGAPETGPEPLVVQGQQVGEPGRGHLRVRAQEAHLAGPRELPHPRAYGLAFVAPVNPVP